MAQQPPNGKEPPQCRGFTITLRHTTLGKTPLDEWSVRCRDLYLITHKTHNRQTSMFPAGLEPVIPASERTQIHALDRTTTAIGLLGHTCMYQIRQPWNCRETVLQKCWYLFAGQHDARSIKTKVGIYFAIVLLCWFKIQRSQHISIWKQTTKMIGSKRD